MKVRYSGLFYLIDSADKGSLYSEVASTVRRFVSRFGWACNSCHVTMHHIFELEYDITAFYFIFVVE